MDLTLLVGPDGDSCAYEPTPQDAIALAEADFIFENGLELESWLDKLYAYMTSFQPRDKRTDKNDPTYSCKFSLRKRLSIPFDLEVLAGKAE